MSTSNADAIISIANACRDIAYAFTFAVVAITIGATVCFSFNKKPGSRCLLRIAAFPRYDAELLVLSQLDHRPSEATSVSRLLLLPYFSDLPLSSLLTPSSRYLEAFTH